jgi:hypothetical protein
MNKNCQESNLLRKLYLFVSLQGVLIIAPTHIFPQPYFMYARFPHYLEMMEPVFGASWPLTFDVYHYILLALAVIFSINILAITFQPRLRNPAIISSSIGLVLISIIVFFFFFVFTKVNLPTAIVYGLYSTVLLVVDFLTLKALLGGKKRQ